MPHSRQMINRSGVDLNIRNEHLYRFIGFLQNAPKSSENHLIFAGSTSSHQYENKDLCSEDFRDRVDIDEVKSVLNDCNCYYRGGILPFVKKQTRVLVLLCLLLPTFFVQLMVAYWISAQYQGYEKVFGFSLAFSILCAMLISQYIKVAVVSFNRALKEIRTIIKRANEEGEQKSQENVATNYRPRRGKYVWRVGNFGKWIEIDFRDHSRDNTLYRSDNFDRESLWNIIKSSELLSVNTLLSKSRPVSTRPYNDMV
mmetsp:Transcript_38974/g.44401  ORF Transcript_38974/g.44401 Transcript_38974/m.44401 type:complete len:256 (+) Transcript_38974:179-946(+)